MEFYAADSPLRSLPHLIPQLRELNKKRNQSNKTKTKTGTETGQRNQYQEIETNNAKLTIANGLSRIINSTDAEINPGLNLDSPPSSSSPPLSPLFQLDDVNPPSYSSSSSSLRYFDFQGLPLTLSAGLSTSAAEFVVSCINEYMHQVLTYGNSYCVISRAVQVDPDCMIANVLMADYCIASEYYPLALKYLVRAKELSRKELGTLRERLYVQAWREWVGEKKHALVTLYDIIIQTPADLFAVKKAQLIAFLQGDLPKMLSIVTLPSVVQCCADRKYYYGMLAFALEENGRVMSAENAARRGFSECSSDVWSAHAIAHCLLDKGEWEKGKLFMEALHQSGTWNYSMSFMYTHAYFHYALFLLELDDCKQVLNIWDEHVWHDKLPLLLPAVKNLLQCPLPVSTNQSSSFISSLPLPLPLPLPLSNEPSFLSFTPYKQNNAGSLNDQFGALLLLWKLEIKLTGIGANQHTCINNHNNKIINNQLPLTSPLLFSRYLAVSSCVAWPTSYRLGYFALLYYNGLLKSCLHDRAAAYKQDVIEKVQSMKTRSGSRRKLKNERILLPLMESIQILFDSSIKFTIEERIKQSYYIMKPIMEPYEMYLEEEQKAGEEAEMRAKSMNSNTSPNNATSSKSTNQVSEQSSILTDTAEDWKEQRSYIQNPNDTNLQSNQLINTDHENQKTKMNLSSALDNQSSLQSLSFLSSLSSSSSSSSSLPFDYLIDGRHVIQVLSGSGEQRSLLSELWLEICLLSNQKNVQLETQQKIINKASKKRLSLYYQRFITNTDTIIKQNSSHSSSSLSSSPSPSSSPIQSV